MKKNRLIDIIINFRFIIICIFIILITICIINKNNYKINYNINNYLPNNSEGKKGLNILKKEYGNLNEIQLLIHDISYDDTLNKIESIRKIKNIKDVIFYDSKSHIEDNQALIIIKIKDINNLKKNIIKKEINKIFKNYNYHLYYMDETSNSNEILSHLPLIIFIIILITLIISFSYFDIVLVSIILVASIILNLESNFLFNSTYYINNIIVTIIQLYLSYIYLFIVLNHYNREIDDSINKYQAVKKTIIKSSTEIIISSGILVILLSVLLFMKIGLGKELYFEIIKAIIISNIISIILLPSLLIYFNNIILKLRHRRFLLDTNKLFNFIISIRKVILLIFIIIFLYFAFCIPKYDISYNIDSINSNTFKTNNKNQDKYNNLVILLKNKKKDYKKEYELSKKLLQDSRILQVISTGNIKIDEKIYLGNCIKYEEFSQLFKIDINSSVEIYKNILIEENEKKDINNYCISIYNLINYLQKKQSNLALDNDSKEKFNLYYTKIINKIDLLETKNYSRLIIKYKDNKETSKYLDMIKNDINKYYSNVTLEGDDVSARDFKNIFNKEIIKISLISTLLLAILLLFIFKSIGITLLIIFITEGSKIINFGIISILYNKIFFINYIIIGIIQIIITVSYSINISKKYQLSRIKYNKKQSLEESFKERSLLIIISNIILVISSFLISYFSSNNMIKSIILNLGIGIIISTICIILILPVLIYTFDKLILRTTFRKTK